MNTQSAEPSVPKALVNLLDLSSEQTPDSEDYQDSFQSNREATRPLLRASEL
jgi:hypothetical protein